MCLQIYNSQMRPQSNSITLKFTINITSKTRKQQLTESKKDEQQYFAK